MSALPSELDGDVLERDPAYRAALLGLTTKVLPNGAPDLVRIYRDSKDLAYRNKILALLADCDRVDLADFFAEAYARERYHSMKLFALRGLAQFATEAEIDARLARLRPSIAKVGESTPLNFVEYEILLGPFCLPYLVDRYGYSSLRATMSQVQAQYNEMPEAVKGLITTDDAGNVIELVAHDEYRLRIDAAISEVQERGRDIGE